MWLLVVGIVLGVALSAAVGVLTSRPATKAAPNITAPHGEAVLVAGGHQYHLEQATTPAQQALGLGGRASMPASSGMLFAYNSTADRCLWMKRMRFPLDMIWLSSQGEVISVQPDVSPKTYPSAYCAFAQDVIELDAGQARAAGIEVNHVLTLDVGAA